MTNVKAVLEPFPINYREKTDSDDDELSVVSVLPPLILPV